ncbi:MAG: ribonuclease HI family protein [Candidatus Eisenbacteria bacterium]|nr:ribonuclease HI family protein [Candidatus Eisenbacteria bacterium]
MKITEKLWHDGPDKISICTDGCARGNPGHAGCGLLVKDGEGRILVKKARYIGTATNNVAEYTALIDGLREAVDLGPREVTILTDSELVVRQMTGEYKVKDVKLKELFAEAQRLSRGFSRCNFVHVERENNKDADSLANDAVDSFLKTGKQKAGKGRVRGAEVVEGASGAGKEEG